LKGVIIMANADWKHSYLEPCPICGRRGSKIRCLFIPGIVVLCYYTPSKLERVGTAGRAYLHFLKDRPERERPVVRHRIVRCPSPQTGRYDLPRLAGKFQTRLDAQRLQALSRELGLTCASLKRLHVGWTAGEMMYVEARGAERAVNAWSFPRFTAAGKVIGISLRPQWGRKFAWTGSGGGLHIPAGFEHNGRAFCCEGPSDTAAALDLQLNAFGRTSSSSDVDHVLAFARIYRLKQLIIFSQRDEPHFDAKWSVYYPAQDGAEILAKAARAYVPDVRIIMPPDHPGDKDVRDWRRRGATPADVEQLVMDAKPRTMSVSVVFSHRRKGFSHVAR
jgi:hypothetical protein